MAGAFLSRLIADVQADRSVSRQQVPARAGVLVAAARRRGRALLGSLRTLQQRSVGAAGEGPDIDYDLALVHLQLETVGSLDRLAFPVYTGPTGTGTGVTAGGGEAIDTVDAFVRLCSRDNEREDAVVDAVIRRLEDDSPNKVQFALLLLALHEERPVNLESLASQFFRVHSRRGRMRTLAQHRAEEAVESVTRSWTTRPILVAEEKAVGILLKEIHQVRRLIRRQQSHGDSELARRALCSLWSRRGKVTASTWALWRRSHFVLLAHLVTRRLHRHSLHLGESSLSDTESQCFLPCVHLHSDTDPWVCRLLIASDQVPHLAAYPLVLPLVDAFITSIATGALVGVHEDTVRELATSFCFYAQALLAGTTVEFRSDDGTALLETSRCHCGYDFFAVYSVHGTSWWTSAAMLFRAAVAFLTQSRDEHVLRACRQVCRQLLSVAPAAQFLSFWACRSADDEVCGLGARVSLVTVLRTVSNGDSDDGRVTDREVSDLSTVIGMVTRALNDNDVAVVTVLRALCAHFLQPHVASDRVAAMLRQIDALAPVAVATVHAMLHTACLCMGIVRPRFATVLDTQSMREFKRSLIELEDFDEDPANCTIKVLLAVCATPVPMQAVYQALASVTNEDRGKAAEAIARAVLHSYDTWHATLVQTSCPRTVQNYLAKYLRGDEVRLVCQYVAGGSARMQPGVAQVAAVLSHLLVEHLIAQREQMRHSMRS